LGAVRAHVEAFLELERAQLPLWFTVAFGSGVAAWLWMPSPGQWIAFLLLVLGLAAAGFSMGGGRLGRAMAFGGWRWPRDAR
jgi:competence protein ComEC